MFGHAPNGRQMANHSRLQVEPGESGGGAVGDVQGVGPRRGANFNDSHRWTELARNVCRLVAASIAGDDYFHLIEIRSIQDRIQTAVEISRLIASRYDD
jgi:hypothetical protein